MRRDTTNILLVLLGGALVKITADGTYLRYVKPTAQPWILISGLVMIALAAVAIVHDLATTCTPDHGHHHHRVGGGGDHHRVGGAWLLLLPILAIFLVAPPALGADSVLRAGNRTTPPATSATLPPLPPGAVIPIPLTEFITRSIWDRSLRGRTIELTGFVVHANGTNYVARLVITCCAADATPMKAALTGHAADQLPDDQWIQVTGQLRPGSATEANGYTPTLTVSALTTVTPPTDPYEY